MEEVRREMQESLRCKEKEFEEFRQSVENVIEEKSKEMSDIIMSLAGYDEYSLLDLYSGFF